MYESALPDHTLQQLAAMAPSALVVGIPSYRNAATIAAVARQVARGLADHYAALHPVIVHADGHAFDPTLDLVRELPLPPTVRRVATAYLGVAGKGSALRAIFEAATLLQAKAVLIVEADTTTFDPVWLPALVEPVLQKQVELLLPRYAQCHPLPAEADLILYPLLASMFQLPVRHPAAGEVALAGGVATFFAERDVWETDVARAGIDVWMTAQVALGGGRLGELHLGAKQHHTNSSPTLVIGKFLQEVGTLFRLGHLHERVWREGVSPPPLITQGSPVASATPMVLPEPAALWRAGQRVLKKQSSQQWEAILPLSHLAAVRSLLAKEEPSPFDGRLWARLVYDFVVVYNLGEGDPDKVVTALYPLYLLRLAALMAEVLAQDGPADAAYEALIQQQAALFQEERPYLLQRWDRYVSPEQLDLWRELGLLQR